MSKNVSKHDIINSPSFFMKPKLGKNGFLSPKLGFDKLLLATFVLAKTTTNEFPYFFLPLILLLPRAKKGNGNPIVGICQNREFCCLFSLFSGIWGFGSRALGLFLRPLLPLRSLRDLRPQKIEKGRKKKVSVRQKPNIVCASLRGKKYSATLFRRYFIPQWAFFGHRKLRLGAYAQKENIFVDSETQVRLKFQSSNTFLISREFWQTQSRAFHPTSRSKISCDRSIRLSSFFPFCFKSIIRAYSREKHSVCA